MKARKNKLIQNRAEVIDDLMEKSGHDSHHLLLLAKQQRQQEMHDSWYRMAGIMMLNDLEKSEASGKEKTILSR